MSVELNMTDYVPSKGIEEVFLSVPEEYVTPPSMDAAAFSDGLRKAMLAGSPGAGSGAKLIVKDAANGYLSYGMQTPAGNWLTEVTYFLNSAGQKLVAVNHVWKGAVWYSHSLYFLEACNELWIDRREGVVPAVNGRDFWKGTGLMQPITPAPHTQQNPVALQQVMYQLPRKGKDLLVLPPQTAEGTATGYEGSLVLSWRDGVFGRENGLLDRYLTVPGAFLKIRESAQESFLAIPKEADNPSNRMRIVNVNNSLAGQIRLGSHPEVQVYEGYVDLGLFENLTGRMSPLLVVSSTCGVGDCGFKLVFLEQQGEKWVDVTSQVFGGIELVAANAAYNLLPEDSKMEEKLTEGRLLVTLDVPHQCIQIGPNVDSYDAEVAPVLVEYHWDGKIFARK